MARAPLYSARQAGEQLGLPHKEVIRRIRRGDIDAGKVGWNYVLTEAQINAAKESDWYKKLAVSQ